jgi:hypothetical protein
MAFSNFGTLVAKYNSSLPTITDGDYVVLQTDVNGRILTKIDVALPTGSNAIGSITNLFALDATLTKLTIAQGAALGANTQALMGGSVTTAAPTYTTGQISPLSLDTSGNLRVVASGGSSSSTWGTATTTAGTITTSSSSIIASSVSQYGSFLVTVQGTYAGVNFGFFASDDAGTTYYPIQAVRLDSFVSETTTGVLTANQSRAWVVTIGGATNFKILASAYTSGTANIRITPTASPYDQAVTVGGTVAATQSGTWNITNISGTVSLPTGAATEATLTKLPIAQSTALGSNSGPLVQGSVTTAAPTYTTGNINPFSLTTAGSLRGDINSIVGNTALVGNGVTGTGSLRVTIASDNTAFTVNAAQSGTWNIGSIAGAITPGTGAGNLGKAEDAAHTSGDTGVFSLAVRNDTASALATTNGDYIPFTTDSLGRLWVNDSGVANPVFEAGTDADTYSDSGGAGDGTVTIASTMTDVAVLAVGAGTTAYICGIDFSCDKNAAMELVVMDGASLVETIRTGLVTPAHPTVVFTFPRAISVVGAATRNVKIRAKSLNAVSTEAGGGINAYTR